MTSVTCRLRSIAHIWLIGTMAFLLSALCLCQAQSGRHAAGQVAPKAAVNWSQFHFTAGGTRFNPYEKTINVKNVHRLRLHWRYDTGLYVYSSPAVVKGVVYVASYNNSVYAISTSTGKKLWSYATAGPIIGSPAVANGLVYIGSTDSKFYALKASDGSLAWSFATDQEQSSPAASDGVVYLGDNFDDLYALNGTTGAVIWSDQGGGGGSSSLTVVNGTLYYGSENSVHAVDAKTGKYLWTYTPNESDASPTVAGGKVYVAGESGLIALDATNGNQIWTFPTVGVVNSTPAVAGGVVYVGDRGGLVYALDGATGNEILAA